MICRGGIVTDTTTAQPSEAVRPHPIDEVGVTRPRRALVATMLVAGAVVAWGAIRTWSIPPTVESDYCYQLIAADRLVAGEGLTSLPPVAPNQPWEWRADWRYLTQWPAGYSLLVAAGRWATGFPTLKVCRAFNLVAWTLGMAGWMLWLRRMLVPGWAAWGVASAGAITAVTANQWIDPSTDLLVVSALPWILLLSCHAVAPISQMSHVDKSPPGAALLLLAGILAGLLVWLRYASVFIPAGLVAFLLLHDTPHGVGSRAQLRARTWRTMVFACGAAIPMLALLATNTLMAGDRATTAQINLGGGASFAPQASDALSAWMGATRFPFYRHHAWVGAAIACLPLAILAACLWSWRRRGPLARWMLSPAPRLSLCLILALAAMLLVCSTLFRAKFDFVRLDRYYLPIKPLCFALMLGPFLLIPRRVVRVGLCGVALIACHWTVTQEWSRPWQRWVDADRERTSYGQWATCFSPNADELYAWLRTNAAQDAIILSNFHEYVALETGLPALPLPPSRDALTRWVDSIRTARNLDRPPRVLLVADPSNRWRDYWIPPLENVTALLQPVRELDAPPRSACRLFEIADITTRPQKLAGAP